MNYKGIRVLILEGYARQSLPMIRAFKQLGCHVSVLCNSKLDVAYVSRYPDKKILSVCDTTRYEETVECVRKLLKSGKYDIAVPLVDFSAKILSHNKQEFEKYAKIASNDKDIFDLAQDKLNVMNVCMNNNIPCPKTIVKSDEIWSVIHTLNFPIIVKPRRDCGARGLHKFNNKEELQIFIDNNKFNIYDYVIQEFIAQDLQNLSCNLFIDDYGNIKSNYVYASYRWFPLKGGTGTFNITVNAVDVQQYSEKIVKLLGLKGCCGVDCIRDPRDNTVKILEINPRVMACARLGFESGVNIAQQILESAFNGYVTSMMDYKSNIRMRMFHTDILWFLKSKDRFKSNPSWFNFINQKEQLFYIDDPLPWFAFLIQGLFRLKKEMKKRSD